jgi:glycosyltransferase involved in cell wall biosynthesis
MRIAYDHQIFGWQRHGGISRYISDVARVISRDQQHAVDIVCPLYINSYLNALPDSVRVHGIQTPAIPRFGRVLRSVNAILAKPLTKRLAPDLVHETYYAASRTAPRGARTILTVHDMIHERFPQYFSSLDPTARDKARAVARADHIVCVSHNTKRDLIETLGVPEERVSVTHLGFLATDNTPRSTEPMSGKPFILYVGNRGGHKNFGMLADAFSASQRLREDFRIICFGGGPLTARDRTTANGFLLDETLLVHQSGTDAALSRLYGQAAVFVYPSLYEGFGIPPLEAMNHDCPVVCSNVSSIPEVVGDAAEYFDPHSAGELQCALERVLYGPSRRQDLIAKGIERLQLFSWERCAAETLKIYERTLS